MEKMSYVALCGGEQAIRVRLCGEIMKALPNCTEQDFGETACRVNLAVDVIRGLADGLTGLFSQVSNAQLVGLASWLGCELEECFIISDPITDAKRDSMRQDIEKRGLVGFVKANVVLYAYLLVESINEFCMCVWLSERNK